MELAVFIEPARVLSLPAALLTVLMIVIWRGTRAYTVPVLLGPALLALTNIGAPPLNAQLTRFSVVFMLLWLAFVTVSLIIWCMVTLGRRAHSRRTESQ